ncbi:protein amnionless isoform X2 [Ischnura elegans]|uniref:protein amnionless isoform X2 n=1 Tax=Ischnura elegans TaxID=197161 RepID=UPI001ED88299|nr:protein amnionless isoform X2 [Ischnura elegans]
MDVKWIAILLSGLAISCADGAIRTKVWHGNTNFQNPYNWRPSHVPCSNSRVIFDSARDLLVMLSPVQTTVKELVLPYNGAIVFPTNGALMFTSDKAVNDHCKNEDVYYVGTELSAWMNPVSWGEKGENTNLGTNSPVPHAERIPCEHDKVMFPSGSGYRVILPRVSTAVGSINIDGQAMGTEEWRLFVESQIGRMQFIGDPNSINILGEDGVDHPCTSATGCYCGNAGPLTMKQICSYAGGPHCETPACLEPVHPIGHCCDICGAVIQVEYLPHSFIMSQLEDHVQRFTSSEVKAHIGKTAATNHVQIVFVDADSYQERSVDSARRLLKVIKNDMSLGVGAVTFQGSGPAIDLSEMYISHSPGKIMALIFAGCALMVIAFLLFLAYGKDIRFTTNDAQAFVFSRFDNMSSRSSGPVIRVWGEAVAEEAQEGKEQPPEESGWVTMESVLAPSKPQAFDNPMYNKPVKDDGRQKIEGAINMGPGKDGKREATSATTMENPVYSALKASEETRKQAKSDSDEKKEPPPPVITKRKVRSKVPKKGKKKREILSEEDTEDSTGSDNMTTVEDLE